ncbi:phage portal protein [Sulfuricurvum sp.]|uniref:phage portal protein n=1 Tax=Sulfuricurvum sp. TaxID=2025608 RepID=UPI003567A254
MIDRVKRSLAEIAKIWGKSVPVAPAPQSRSMNIRDIIQKELSRRSDHYAAGYTNRIRDDWPTTSSIPYTDIKQQLSTIIARSRREIDNNGIASGIRRTIVNNVWGEGPIVQAQVKLSNGEIQKGINDELEYAWMRHSEELDATGQSNFALWGKEALETIISSGTVLFNRVPARKGSYLNLAYQMLEPDILDTSKDDQKITQDQNRPEKQVLHGIAIDEYYRPVKYWIKGINNAISAEYMKHFYQRTRPNQVIGVPWLHASLPDLFDYREIKEDYMTKLRILADIALWSDPSGDVFFNNVTKNSDGEALWEPGTWIKSKNEPKVIQADGDLNTALKPLLNRVLLDACCGVGTSYMAVSRDMDGVNFAASRTNLNEDRAGYKVHRTFMDFQVCQWMWNQFVYQCVIEGKVTISPDRFLADPYRYTRVSFQFPAWDWVDPKADSAAMVNMKGAGLNSLNDICSKRGIDWRDYIDQVATEIDYIKKAVAGKDVTPEELMAYFKNSDGVEDAEESKPAE